MLTPLSDPPPGPAPTAAGGGGAPNPHKMAAIFSPPPTQSPAGLLPRLPGLDPRPPRLGGASSEATRRPRPLVPGSHGVREPERHKGVT